MLQLVQPPPHTAAHEAMHKAWTMVVIRNGRAPNTLRRWCLSRWRAGPEHLTTAQARHAQRQLNAWAHALGPAARSAALSA